MKHTASKIFRALCGMAVMLALVAGITSVPVSAASNGIYIATATPHYKHPTTGVIEDAGGDGSSVLGQSMTESATYKKALVEVDPQGNTYITVRLQLMDNIQNPKFQVDGSPVSASLMQEDYTKNTADYRMKVNSEKSVIRCNMYVTAMGRDVIFYITVSNLQAGSDDFITSVKVETQSSAENQKPAETQAPAGTQKPDENQNVAETKGSEAADTKESTAENTVSTESLSSTERANDETPAGLQEFDASGNRVEGENVHKANQNNGVNTVIWWVLGIIAAVAAAGGCVWYFCFFKKNK